MVDFRVGIRDVREMPLGRVIEDPLRFKNGDKALALSEPARLGHGAPDRSGLCEGREGLAGVFNGDHQLKRALPREVETTADRVPTC